MFLQVRHWSAGALLRANLLLFLTSGTLLCFWFWRYTDYFDEVGAVLALSGALSWIAVVLKVVPEEKFKALQGAFFTWMFENPQAVRWNLLLLVAMVAVCSCFGTVQLTPHHDPGDRAVIVCPSSEASEGAVASYWTRRMNEDDFDIMPPTKDLRVPVAVFWGLRRDFVVKVAGYPDKAIRLKPWERKELVVPNSFRRPIVLLRPTERLINNARQHPWKLRVRIGRDQTVLPFDGHAVWIGCDADVQVPQATKDSALQTLDPILRTYWDCPVALSWPLRELTPGVALEIELVAPSGVTFHPFARPPLIERVSGRPDFFPQVLDLELNDPP